MKSLSSAFAAVSCSLILMCFTRVSIWDRSFKASIPFGNQRQPTCVGEEDVDKPNDGGGGLQSLEQVQLVAIRQQKFIQIKYNT